MPYRIDISRPPADALDLLVQLGALDVEAAGDGLAAIVPDSVRAENVALTLGLTRVTVSNAIARDSGSVWLVSPRTARIGSLVIVPEEASAASGALRLKDARAFGTGHHPTTVLCVEALEEILVNERVNSLLDVGTGSGILALAALMMGTPKAVGVDIDADALKAAAANARLNHLDQRLQLFRGGPDAVSGCWPLVVANVLAAPLIEMAPMLVRRMATRGRLILSGIHSSLEAEVWETYEHLGVRHISSKTHAGWVVVIAQASW